MNDYERRQQARKERYERRADQARDESERRYDTATEIARRRPFGQPILVGHHSERMARRDQERIETNMRASIEAQQHADYYERKAAAVGMGGISGDDPDALEKLRGRLAELQDRHARLEEVNRVHRLYRKNPAAARYFQMLWMKKSAGVS